MSEIAILVEGLSKQYRIGASSQRYNALRDKIAGAAVKPFRAMKSLINRNGSRVGGDSKTLIWALKDVSFEIKCGEVVGVVGRNGAGKSTLLKILSRITDPTTGRAEIRGRLGSLLEVGTGFHTELTGRENIFLNGAILGMRKGEIERKFDEIVAFAEVEKFIDTPIKHYSSGMHMRLAFAVAAHLESEILMVDEVLAVGDAQFQRKCLGKMGAVANEGRTVVLVSHQMNQIRRLCGNCLWLNCGSLSQFGPTAQVLSNYEAAALSADVNGDRGNPDSVAQFLKWEIAEPRAELPNWLQTMGPFILKFLLRVNKPLHNGSHGIAVLRETGQNMWGTAHYGLDLQPGVYELIHSLPNLLLQPGVYYWQVSISDEHGLIDLWDCQPELMIATRPVTHPRDEYAGILNLPSEFHIQPYTPQSRRLHGYCL